MMKCEMRHNDHGDVRYISNDIINNDRDIGHNIRHVRYKNNITDLFKHDHLTVNNGYALKPRVLMFFLREDFHGN